MDILDTKKFSAKDVLKLQSEQHSAPKKIAWTVKRKDRRLDDINVIKKNFPEAKTVLCIGCRDNSEVQAFIDSGFSAMGVDIVNESNLIKKLDAHELDGRFGNFDVVYSSHSLEHMYDVNKVMRNIRGVEPKCVTILLPFQLKTYGARLKHPTVFELMKIDARDESLQSIMQKKVKFFTDSNNHKEIWEDFSSLAPFEIVNWEFREGIGEREICICLKLK